MRAAATDLPLFAVLQLVQEIYHELRPKESGRLASWFVAAEIRKRPDKRGVGETPEGRRASTCNLEGGHWDTLDCGAECLGGCLADRGHDLRVGG